MKNKIKCWRLHPQACLIKKAEQTCLGSANKDGVKWCHPYKLANSYGFWIYPPVNFKFIYKEKIELTCLENYSEEDYKIIRSLISAKDDVDPNKWCPKGGRTKFTVGAVEENVIQIWSGLIFKTPKDWGLLIRSPINFEKKPYHVMEGFLETDWLQYDIWINLICDEKNKEIEIKKEEPIAQIIPVRKDSLNWEILTEKINRNSQESNEVFKFWINYNKNKFENGGEQFLSKDGSLKKDSTTYFKQRKKEQKQSCPFSKFIGKFIK